MPTVTLLPGDLAVMENPDSLPAMIVGDTDQWADGSDATYGVSYRAAGGDVGWVSAPLDVFTGTAASVTAATVTLRALYDSPGTADTVTAEIRTAGGSNGIGGAFTVPNDAAIHDLSYTYTDADYAAYGAVGGAGSPAELAAFLAAGACGLDFIVTFTGSLTTLTVYEAAVVLTLGRKPHCRTYPRDDRRGPSARTYPPPRSTQTPGRVTGYQ